MKLNIVRRNREAFVSQRTELGTQIITDLLQCMHIQKKNSKNKQSHSCSNTTVIQYVKQSDQQAICPVTYSKYPLFDTLNIVEFLTGLKGIQSTSETYNGSLPGGIFLKLNKIKILTSAFALAVSRIQSLIDAIYFLILYCFHETSTYFKCETYLQFFSSVIGVFLQRPPLIG